MVEKQEIGRDAQLAMLLHHKWRAEIERAVDKVKLGVVPAKKRTKLDKWVRRQWYRTQMRNRKQLAGFLIHTVQAQDYNKCNTQPSSVATAIRYASSKGGFA